MLADGVLFRRMLDIDGGVSARNDVVEVASWRDAPVCLGLSQISWFLVKQRGVCVSECAHRYASYSARKVVLTNGFDERWLRRRKAPLKRWFMKSNRHVYQNQCL